MAGLVPAIHVFALGCKKDVDARDLSAFPRVFRRVMRGHDDQPDGIFALRKISNQKIPLDSCNENLPAFGILQNCPCSAAPEETVRMPAPVILCYAPVIRLFF
jgi:hypothetical protein